MTTPSTQQAPTSSAPRRVPKDVRRPGDKIFSGTALAAGLTIVITLAGVGIFLLIQGYPGIVDNWDAFSTILPIALFGTVYAAVLALLLATPVAIGIGLFISHYANRKVANSLGYLVDLLAAVPSVVYGLWGVNFLAPRLVPLFRWLEDDLGFLPFFTGPVSATGRTMLTAGLVLAVMILPIMTAICREVFLQTPRLHEEAALALGATRWEMIRTAVLPYGRSGMISAAMLGLGRALGETLAVALVLSVSGGITLNLIGNGNPTTIAANIALQFPESTGLAVNTLIATGLVLFVLTFVVNFAARAIIARRAEFSGAQG